METIIKEIYQGIMDGQHKAVEARVQAALQAGISPKTLLNEGMIAAMAEVGRLFEAGEYYVPEMLISARAMQTGLAILKPYLKDADVKPSGRTPRSIPLLKRKSWRLSRMDPAKLPTRTAW